MTSDARAVHGVPGTFEPEPLCEFGSPCFLSSSSTTAVFRFNHAEVAIAEQAGLAHDIMTFSLHKGRQSGN